MITVVHIDTERTWRGGEGQVHHLVSRLPADRFRSIVAAPIKSALIDRVRRDGIPVIPLRSRGEISIRQYLDLVRGVRHFSANIIHVHTSHGLVSAGFVRDRVRSGIKIVYSRRTDFHLRTGFLGISKRKYLWGADRIIAVSDAIRTVLAEDGIPADRVLTIHSGIDVDRFDWAADGVDVRQEWGIPTGVLCVGMVAALAPHKDPMMFLRAVEIVGQEYPDTWFMIIGAGTMWNNVVDAQRRSSVGDRIVLTGFRTDVPRLLAAIDVFCMSSREEGLCTSILDAMAMGKPVVATVAGGIPEAVGDGVTGLLSPIGDAKAFANNIMAILADHVFRRRLGCAGRHRVTEKFSIQRTVARTAEVYEELAVDRT
ncbi:glycosyltransferase family 4 protein [bacterium]|nr:glycosyltransferase family 4 protein [candidate division CSSED10-310 bacterium]